LEGLYSKIQKIEDEVKKHEHVEGQVGFYFLSRKVAMSLEDLSNLKSTLLEEKIIGDEDKVFLVDADDPCEDIKAVCNDYYISSEFAQAFADVIEDADKYYKVAADGFYERTGYLWADCRVVSKDGEYVLMVFYICD